MQAYKLILTLTFVILSVSAFSSPVKSVIASREIVNTEEDGGWRNPYPTDGLSYVWSCNMGEEPDKETLFSILTDLYNSRSDFTVSIACRYNVASYNGIELFVLCSPPFGGPFSIITRNAGTVEQPNQRPYVYYDGTQVCSSWSYVPELGFGYSFHIAISSDSSGYTKCMNIPLDGPIERTRTMTATGSGSILNTELIGCVLIYSRAMTGYEMQSLYYIHSKEFGWGK